jgi:predicted dehydrogenase
MKIYSIAVIGPGLIGREHISLIEKNPRCRLHSVVTPEAPHSEDVTLVFNSLQDCLAHSVPDGVIIASPTHYHYEQAAFCLSNGIKCLVEKPICGTVREARRLLELSNHSEDILVGHHRHHSSIIDAAQQLLSTQNLGELRTVIASAQYYKPDDYYLEKKWRVLPGVGGVLLINAIHDIGLLRHLVGEIVTVQAFGKRSRISPELYGTVSINMEFANSVMGSLVISDEVSSINSWEVTSGENPNFPNYNDGFAYIFGGTRGSMSLPSGATYLDPSCNGWRAEMSKSIFDHKVENPLENQLNHFIDMIEKGANPKIGVEEGIRNLAVVEAIEGSLSKGGTPIPVESANSFE